jgi:hypothetical protein
LPVVARSRRPIRRICIIEDGAVVVVGDVFALLEGEILVDGDEGLRHLGDGDTLAP